jgi:hypothetical protein
MVWLEHHEGQCLSETGQGQRTTKGTKTTRITRNEIVSFVVFVVEIFVPFVIQTADKWQG